MYYSGNVMAIYNIIRAWMINMKMVVIWVGDLVQTDSNNIGIVNT